MDGSDRREDEGSAAARVRHRGSALMGLHSVLTILASPSRQGRQRPMARRASCLVRPTHHAARTTSPSRGFTLIELLVALAVMALLALVSWRGIDAMVRSQELTRQRADELLVVQTVLAQWGADLDALQAIEHTEPIAWDGQVLRLTRRSTRTPEDGALVVAWARRSAGGAPQWLRWQSLPVRTREQWRAAWQQAALWARTPGEAERRGETLLMPLADWQLFYFRGGAWANALSSNAVAPGGPRSLGGPSEAALRIPEGVRLSITLPAGGALAGTLTRDWVNPLVGGGKS